MTSASYRVIIYARYSTELQNPKSVEDQIALCRREAEARGWIIVGERRDEGISGTRDDRPGFRALVSDVESGLCDLVMFESLDRLSRDTEHTARFYKIATHHEVELFALDGGLIDSLRLGFSATMAAAFLENLAFKTRRGLGAKVAAGQSGGGRAYGYTTPLDDSGERRTGELVVDEFEAEVIQRIFRDYAAGMSPLKIAAALNAELIPAPRGTGAGSGHWRQNTINGNRERGTGIVNNELYIGRRIWNRLRYSKDPNTGRRVSRLNPESKLSIVEVPNLRIVSDDLWQGARARQKRMTHQRDTEPVGDPNKLSLSRAHRRRKFLLSGLIRCGICGGSMTPAGGTARGGTRKYYCATAKEKGKSVCPGVPGISQKDVEEFALSGLREHLMLPEVYEQFRKDFAEHFHNMQGDVAASLRVKDELIREKEKTHANLLRAVESGTFSQVIIDRLNAVHAELVDLRAQRQAATPEVVDLPEDIPELFRAHIAEIADSLSEEGFSGRAGDLMRDHIVRLTVLPQAENRMELECNLVIMLAKANPAGEAGYVASAGSLELVAGTGFEPVTFRL